MGADRHSNSRTATGTGRGADWARLRGIRVAVIHSPRSPCECHLTVHAAGERFGFEVSQVADDALDGDLLAELRPAVVVDTTESYRGVTEWRWWPRAVAERLGLPVVGSPARIVRLCDNKALARQVLIEAGVAVARGVIVPDGSPDSVRLALAAAALDGPVVVKPIAEHGSAGVALCVDREAVAGSLALGALGASEAAPLLVEEFLPGREFHVCLSDIPALQGLPVVEIHVSGGIYTSAQKRGPDAVTPVALAGERPELELELRAIARRAFAALHLRGLARIDVRLDRDEQPRVLEANAKPSLEVGCALDVASKATGSDVVTVVAAAILDRLTGSPSRG